MNEASSCDRCGTDVPDRLRRAVESDGGRREDGGFVCVLCEPPKGSHGRQGVGAIFFKILFLGILATAGYFLQTCSYSRIAELRQIERVPRTKVVAAVSGEVNLAGRAERAEPDGKLLKSTDTKTECLYFHYTKEREERDSDGDTRWVTVDQVTKKVPFDLDDTTGRLRIEPGGSVDFNVEESHQRRVGNLRYTEYRIDPGDRVFIFGFHEKRFDGVPVVRFDAEGDYQPIISEKTELGERKGRALLSVWMCWGGLGFIGAATAVLFSLVGLHRILVFFGLLSIVIGAVLLWLGLNMMVDDLEGSQGRVVRQEKVVQELIQRELGEYGESWSGTWETLGNISDFKAAPAKVRTRLRRVRIDLASAARRVNGQASSFPYNLVRPFVKVERPSAIPLPERDEEFLVKLDAQFESARLSAWSGPLISVLGLLAAAGALALGFRAIRHKRLIENLPTTPTSGLTYGLCEIQGIVDLPEEEEPLKGPLSDNPCTAYHYTIKEKRGSGKNSKWVTIHRDQQRLPFLCRDREGTVMVHPQGADVDPWRSTTRREGRRRHEETRIQLGDPVYALGLATMDEQKGDTLCLRRPDGDTDDPFIISGYQEKRLLQKGGTKGAIILTIAFAAVLLAGLMLSGTLGSFNPASYLSAALIGPVLMMVVATVLHFNDLVFLRDRCRRNWANIDVALHKRYDLIPRLQEVAAETMRHEKSLQSELAALRAASQSSGGSNGESVKEVGEKLSSGHAAAGRLIALAEGYPEIAAGGPMAVLMRELVTCENEIAFISAGYNDAVETYNTRIASIPDVFLAKLGRFREMDLLSDPPDRMTI